MCKRRKAMKKPKIWKINDIVYYINVADIQEVADQELERELSSEEIDLIIDRIAENISWYDAISMAINELIVQPNSQS
jgi:hypothetical protein